MIRTNCEFEISKLRNADIECPFCDMIYDAMGCGKTESGGRIHDAIDLEYGIFKCPECGGTLHMRQHIDELNIIST